MRVKEDLIKAGLDRNRFVTSGNTEQDEAVFSWAR